MSEHEMEQFFQKKFEGFESEPPNDHWPAIEARLKNRNKYRVLFWLLPVLLFGGIGFGLLRVKQSGEKALVMQPSSIEKPETSLSPVTSTPEKAPDATPNTPKTIRQNLEGISRTQGGASFRQVPFQSDGAVKDALENPLNNGGNPTPLENLPTPENQGNTMALTERTDDTSASIPADDKTAILPAGKSGLIVPLAPSNDKSKKRKSFFQMESVRLGVSGSAAFSRFSIAAPNSSSGIRPEWIKGNRDLYEKMQDGGQTFSQGLHISFLFRSGWQISSGIQLHQTLQRLRFDAVTAQQDLVIGPRDFPEGKGGSSVYTDGYQFPTDSIIPGKRIQTVNQYLGREIPFQLAYHFRFNPKWHLTLQGGISYRWVSGVSAYLPDLDNVGLVYLRNKSYYPGIRSTWNFQAGLGIEYALNPQFRLAVSPFSSWSRQSNIRFNNWVRQQQREFGVQIRVYRVIGR